MGRVRAKKSLGQYWLVDRRVLGRIDKAADFADADTVVEVGSGTGLLTELLARRATRLIGVEMDEDLVEGLRRRFQEATNVSFVSADVMSITPAEILGAGGGSEPYVVVGNLPYNIGTAVVGRFLQAEPQPRWLVVTLQAEVAQSMTAGAGEMSYLGVVTQVLAEAQILFFVPARAFRPPPKVRSAVVRLDVREEPVVPEAEREAFLRLAQAGFAAPRKHMRNSLAIGLRTSTEEAEELLAEAGIDPSVRPAAVGLEGWVALHRARNKELGTGNLEQGSRKKGWGG